MVDEWSGFADLLTGLIEKYALELDVESLPLPSVMHDARDSTAVDKKDADPECDAVAYKIAA